MNLVLPNNYTVLEQEEMLYLDGGWNLALPNGVVSGAVDGAITVALSASGVGGALKLGAKALLKKIGYNSFKNIIVSELKKRIGTQAAVVIGGVVAGALTGTINGYTPGSIAANYWDSHDSNPNNGWCDF